MKEVIEKATQLTSQGQYEEAYNLLTDAIKDNKKNYDIYYSRGIIDCLHLKKNFLQTIEDFEYVISKTKKYNKILHPFLTLLYDISDDIDKVIIYGEICKESVDDEMRIDIYWALTRAYLAKGDRLSLEKARKYIEDCVEASEEDIEDYYYCKCEILLAQEKYQETEDFLECCYLKFQGSFNYYYLKTRIYFQKAFSQNISKEEKINLLQEASTVIDTASAYAGEDGGRVITLKAEILDALGDYNKALDTIIELVNYYPTEDVIIERLKIYENNLMYKEAKNECIKFLEKNESWKVEYSYGYLLSIGPENVNDLEEALKFLNSSYEKTKHSFILNDIFRLNKLLHYEKASWQLLNEVDNKFNTDGNFYRMLSETALRLNKPYEDIMNLYTLTYLYKGISEFEYFDNMVTVDHNPKIWYGKLAKYKKIDAALLSDWVKRRTGIRYLYGEDGYEKDQVKGFNLIKAAADENDDISCYQTTLARAFELTNHPEEAFKKYQEAFIIYNKEVRSYCNCAAGYLAHAYIKGIGTEIDLEKAKNLILNAVEIDREYSSNINLYLYAYFFLLGDKRFDGNNAKYYLEVNNPYYRYEVSRLVMLRQVNIKLGINDKTLDNLIKKAWKYLNNNDRLYYKKSLKEDVTYPNFNNY